MDLHVIVTPAPGPSFGVAPSIAVHARPTPVMVEEIGVLLRIELRAGRSGIAGMARADLVEHDHRVRYARLADRLDERAGQRAEVGAPVARDFGLVAQTD